MAFNPIRIFPNDIRARVAIGVDIPFNGSAVFKSNYQTKDAIKNNLINYFLTEPGERIGNPNFGAGLKNYIFSQINDGNLDFIKEDIQTKLNRYFSNVLIKELNITQSYVDSIPVYNITFKYKIANTNISDTLTIGFSWTLTKKLNM